MTEYRKLHYYTYYDTPDGCDIVKKTLVTTRYGFITGMILSTYDVLMYSHVTRFSDIVKRYARHTVPLCGMGFTFSIVANLLVDIRDADDHWNYIGGALAAAPIFGRYMRSVHAWVIGSVFFSIAGVLKKSSVDYCWTLFPLNVPRQTGLVTSRDYTILKDIKIYPDPPPPKEKPNPTKQF